LPESWGCQGWLEGGCGDPGVRIGYATVNHHIGGRTTGTLQRRRLLAPRDLYYILITSENSPPKTRCTTTKIQSAAVFLRDLWSKIMPLKRDAANRSDNPPPPSSRAISQIDRHNKPLNTGSIQLHCALVANACSINHCQGEVLDQSTYLSLDSHRLAGLE
jgi:hypothetical protein